MYKYKAIENFIDKVNKEAAEAANKVYQKYEPQLVKMIQQQLHPYDELYIGMGSVSIDRKGEVMERFYDVKSNFTRPIVDTQYQPDKYSIGFVLPSLITKEKP